jgi:4-aminobutyrate aminotransferase-like enzyme
MPRLTGDQLPRLVTPIPGPRARALAGELHAHEAPGVNTLPADFGLTPPVHPLIDPPPPGSPATDEYVPIAWAAARGANVVDVDDNRYLDLTAGFGVAAVGHRHPQVVAAARHQAGRLLHALGDVHAHPLRAALARRLGEHAPSDDPRVYFAVSGADAVEIALKTAQLSTGRSGVLAFEPGYHGLTLGALAVTSRPEFRQPFAGRLARRAVRRLPFGCAAERLDEALRAATIGAVIVEPIVGREGVLLPPPGWLAALAAACRRHGALLIADEIFTGFGRTGRWFAVEHEGVRPDLLCCGKALGGGLPIAAVVGSAERMACWRRPGEALHTATHMANPLACAAALAVLDLLEELRLPERAAELGPWVEERIAPWRQRATVREVRGRGLLWGIELTDRETAYRWAAAALARGVIVLAGGPQGRVVQLCPPLTITRRQLGVALTLLGDCLPAG